MSRNKTPRRAGLSTGRNIQAMDTVSLAAADELARRLEHLRALAAEDGYTLACRCTACGHPLTAQRSVARAMGPVCRSKEVGR